MKTKTIYVDEELPISEALDELTDERILDGRYCDQTVIDLRNALIEARAKLSERKTVHEWLNDLGIPREEAGKPICLLRRLSITVEKLREYREMAAIACHFIDMLNEYIEPLAENPIEELRDLVQLIQETNRRKDELIKNPKARAELYDNLSVLFSLPKDKKNE